jgi:hypothetical protein
MRNKIVWAVILIALSTSLITPASAQVLQHLPWVAGASKSASAINTTGISGYSGTCNNHHSAPTAGKIDFGLSSSDRVRAAEAGTVVVRKDDCNGQPSTCGSGWGNHVLLRHASDRYTTYAHFDTIESAVTVNQAIGAAEILGVPGSTGQASGVHLHFERWTCNSQSCSTYPLFYEGTDQVFPNPEGRLVCGSYTSTNEINCGAANVVVQGHSVGSGQIWDCSGTQSVKLKPTFHAQTGSEVSVYID